MTAIAEAKKTKRIQPATKADVPGLCEALQRLQRRRAVCIKSRIMQANRLQAIVAGTLGYSAGMEEKERKQKFKEATAIIDGVLDGTTESPFDGIIRATNVGIDALEQEQAAAEREMLQIAARLPVAAWVEQPDQRGFGLLSLATVIGECGDLSNYANPAKVWRRMGCAPFESRGIVQMGKTWRTSKDVKLSSDEWEEFGYSPRRRSIAYVIGENLLKGNKSIYRDRYLEAKAKMAADHAGDERYPPIRCHLHGMLLATKRVLRNLWVEWRREGL